IFFFFFFSSRRRHTRSKRDWSSDVCSSDLVDHNVTATVKSYDEVTESSRCYFPHSGQSFRYEDLVYVTGLVKSGCHDPKGMMLLYGRCIQRGGHVAECNNLDIAPTLLTLLGL